MLRYDSPQAPSLPELLERALKNRDAAAIRSELDDLDWVMSEQLTSAPHFCGSTVEYDNSLQAYVPSHGPEFIGATLNLYFRDGELVVMELNTIFRP